MLYEFVIFLKPIVDMLWQYKILSLIVILLSFVLLFMQIRVIRIDYITIITLWWLVLSFITFINLTNSNSFNIFIKVSSNLIMLAIGRSLYNKRESISNKLFISYTLVLLTNIVIIIIGKGSILWGNSVTLKGVYFFKTDFALAIIQTFIFIRFIPNKYKYIKYLVMYGVVPVLVLLSNARAYLIAYILLMLCSFIEQLEIRKIIRKFKINLATGIIAFFFVVSGIVLMSSLSNTELFKSLHLISFDLNSKEGLYNGANTQGRNVIWKCVINQYEAQPTFNKVFGVDYVSDIEVNPLKVDSHNNYIKILYSFGILGLLIFILLIIFSICKTNEEKDIKFKFTYIMLLISYLVSGFSVSNISYTQQSWIFFLYMGIIFGYDKKCKSDFAGDREVE